MARHVADTSRRPASGARLRHYTEIERAKGGPRPQTRALQQRPREAGDDSARTRAYLRIARGWSA